MRITVINGPNINMTGIREPEVYGSRTYGDLVGYIEETCLMHGAECEVFQSNHEGAIVDRIQECLGRTDAIVINAGAYSHTSIAILDALKSVSLPVAEAYERHNEKGRVQAFHIRVPGSGSPVHGKGL